MTAAALAANYRLHLIARETAAASALEHAHAHAVASITPHLHALLQAYQAKQQALRQEQDDDEAHVPLHWLHEHRRLEALLALIFARIGGFATVAQASITHLLHSAAQLGQQSALAQVNSADAVPIPTSRLAERVAHAEAFVGERVANFAHEVVSKVKGALLVGIPLGMSALAIGRRIAQALDGPRWQARALARTQGFGVYRGVQTDVWVKNDAGFWIWRAQPGACTFCLSMDGTRHPVSEEMETHDNCRCDKELEAA